MASISIKREDWNAIDPIRDVKYLADYILKEEARLARTPEPVPKKGLDPELVAKLLPQDMQEPIHGRKPLRVPMVHLILRTYIGIYVDAPARSWEELSRVRRFLVMHVLYNGLKTQIIDLAPVTLATAQATELLLGVIRRANNGEFLRVPKYRNYPICFMATEILSLLMHRHCSAHPIIMEKFFRDIPGGPHEVVQILDMKLIYESFSVVRLFGFASSHPSTCLWLLKHPKALLKILKFSHTAVEMGDSPLDKTTNLENYMKMMCTSTLREDHYVLTSDIMALYTASMSAFVFNNMMHHFGDNYDEFRVLRKVVYDAKIIQNFFKISRNLMRWLTPGRFISGFLKGIYRCMEMDLTAQFLFVDDFKYCREHKISARWDCLKYFNHPTLRPSHMTFLLCHALSVKYLIGANWAMAIIVYTLENCSDEVCRQIIEKCGYELLDMAHALTLRDPLMTVQNVVMEALLKYAGFSYKVWCKADSFNGPLSPVKDIPEFCVEAALYCRRASLEESLPEAEKQYRVKLADEKKEQGNTCFKKSRFKEAIELYTEALALCPLSARSKQAVYYSNRAECYLRVSDPQQAVHDCNRSLCLDQTMFVKVQWRRSRAYQRLNMVYPAWLDMYCIKDEWKSEKVDSSGVDFTELESGYREKVCLVDKEEVMLEEERKAVDCL